MRKAQRRRTADPEILELEEAKAIAQVRQNPNGADAWMDLGIVRQKLGRLQDAEVAFCRAVALDESNFWAHVCLSNFYYALRNHSAALREAKRAQELRPTNVIGYTSAANAYILIRHFGKAAREYKKASVFAPDDPLLKREWSKMQRFFDLRKKGRGVKEPETD